jgi:hypothetical protein
MLHTQMCFAKLSQLKNPFPCTVNYQLSDIEACMILIQPA